MHANLLVVTLCASVLVGCGDGRNAAVTQAPSMPPTLPADSGRPIILMYDEQAGLVSVKEPHQPLDVAVWGNGKIVWREGNSLLEGRVDPAKIDGLLQQLHKDGAFEDGKARHRHFGPDSGFDVIDIRLSDRSLRMESWHEGFEQNPNLVVTSHGVSTLDGRDRATVLAAEPAEFLAFRKLWADVRTAIHSWRPDTGQAFTGTVSLPPIE